MIGCRMKCHFFFQSLAINKNWQALKKEILGKHLYSEGDEEDTDADANYRQYLIGRVQSQQTNRQHLLASKRNSLKLQIICRCATDDVLISNCCFVRDLLQFAEER